MAQLDYGDVICTIQETREGRFQGKVIVAASVLKNREGLVHLCPEIDDSRTRALHRAMDFVDKLFPSD